MSAEDIRCTSQESLQNDVPLSNLEQDEYTTLRPYPCDFCSRRFRKQTTLMNHIVGHQYDRSIQCKLCGCCFQKRTDLINHLKEHVDDGPGRTESLFPLARKQGKKNNNLNKKIVFILVLSLWI